MKFFDKKRLLPLGLTSLMLLFMAPVSSQTRTDDLVVVTGYDENAVYIQDGALKYTRDWNTFLLSWGALGNRAIYVK